mmetsp:Transcript_25008/g.50893  ORF Transcript_25008/g.50893 Transcript_25008/m.50893 type:complete len:633 (-) Transcript_25008:343-2241(-)
MIEYYKGLYGLGLLLRVHGSPLYKAAIPGAVAAAIYLIIVYRWIREEDAGAFNHPYAVGVLVTSVSFLIVFRANNAYQRYWEACGAVHHMMSKWLDAVTHTGCYHMQCKHYDSIKPPSYFDHPDLNRHRLTRDRECISQMTPHSAQDAKSLRLRRRVEKSIEYVQSNKKRDTAESIIRNSPGQDPPIYQSHGFNHQLMGPARLDGGWGSLFPDEIDGPKATHYKFGSDDTTGPPIGFDSTRGGRTHSLFLQELAHLASLCVAVAFCTLRGGGDVEGMESPVDIYRPGEPWPEADPDKLPMEVRDFMGWNWTWIRNMKYWCGFTRTPSARARHNASRPMLVIGGVSANEIAFLQKARGPSAKVTLAWCWLSEFIIREQLAGTLGKVGPPIISRIFQFLSDGMIYYNHARKIMYIPFPFPHAQLSAFFVLIMVPTIPLLMGQFTNYPWLGATLTFLTVTCLVGLHEVARELENPYRNMPNDIPLVTMLAMFNESLITMYAGYHPDHYWDDQVSKLNMRDSNGELNNTASPVSMEPTTQAKPSTEQTASGIDAPQSADGSMTNAHLLEMIKKQSQEIERLKGLIEPNVVIEPDGVSLTIDTSVRPLRSPLRTVGPGVSLMVDTHGDTMQVPLATV